MPKSQIDDPRYRKGIEYFNECEFFEAHDEWEELWSEYQGPSRRFLQGMIQAAVCLHHFGNGNSRGAVKLYHSSRAYLEPYQPKHWGIQLDIFLQQMENCCRDIIQCEDLFPKIAIDPERIPEIHLEIDT